MQDRRRREHLRRHPVLHGHLPLRSPDRTRRDVPRSRRHRSRPPDGQRTSTKAKIGGLLDGKTADAATAQALRSCQVLYDGILQRQPGSAAAVKGGKFSEAISSLEKSAAAAKECEDGFSKSHVASPVTVENSNAFQLAKLAVGLLYS
ncbi:putative invertase inhibitor [Hordeum vulgare]|nr:putative invertase inhibitor [Hordeum vulgare]